VSACVCLWCVCCASSHRHPYKVHSTHTNNVANMKEDLAASEEHIPRLEGELIEASQRYSFFQETRGYVRDLLACLAEKVGFVSSHTHTHTHTHTHSLTHMQVPEMEQIESRMHLLWLDTAGGVCARRERDAMDEEEHIRAPTRPHTHAHTHAPHGSADDGGDDTTQRTHRMARRAARMQARSHRRVDGSSGDGGGGSSVRGSANGDGGHGGEGSGECVSDVELDSEQEAAWQDRRGDILEDAAAVFDNVLDEFAELSTIAKRFDEWKLQFPQEYTDAYISMTLRKILQPLVTFQLLEWNPLTPTCPAVEELPWFNALVFFGVRDGVEPPPLDPDAMLVPDLVELTVLPKLAGLLEFVYDPLSSSQVCVCIVCAV
jgi:GC-rich sequence DNA-binding factor